MSLIMSDLRKQFTAAPSSNPGPKGVSSGPRLAVDLSRTTNLHLTMNFENVYVNLPIVENPFFSFVDNPSGNHENSVEVCKDKEGALVLKKGDSHFLYLKAEMIQGTIYPVWVYINSNNSPIKNEVEYYQFFPYIVEEDGSLEEKNLLDLQEKDMFSLYQVHYSRHKKNMDYLHALDKIRPLDKQPPFARDCLPIGRPATPEMIGRPDTPAPVPALSSMMNEPESEADSEAWGVVSYRKHNKPQAQRASNTYMIPLHQLRNTQSMTAVWGNEIRQAQDLNDESKWTLTEVPVGAAGIQAIANTGAAVLQTESAQARHEKWETNATKRITNINDNNIDTSMTVKEYKAFQEQCKHATKDFEAQYRETHPTCTDLEVSVASRKYTEQYILNEKQERVRTANDASFHATSMELQIRSTARERANENKAYIVDQLISQNATDSPLSTYVAAIEWLNSQEKARLLSMRKGLTQEQHSQIRAALPSDWKLLKTQLCRNYEKTGKCAFGSLCIFAHGMTQLAPDSNYIAEKLVLTLLHDKHIDVQELFTIFYQHMIKPSVVAVMNKVFKVIHSIGGVRPAWRTYMYCDETLMHRIEHESNSNVNKTRLNDDLCIHKRHFGQMLTLYTSIMFFLSDDRFGLPAIRSQNNIYERDMEHLFVSGPDNNTVYDKKCGVQVSILIDTLSWCYRWCGVNRDSIYTELAQKTSHVVCDVLKGITNSNAERYLKDFITFKMCTKGTSCPYGGHVSAESSTFCNLDPYFNGIPGDCDIKLADTLQRRREAITAEYQKVFISSILSLIHI